MAWFLKTALVYFLAQLCISAGDFSPAGPTVGNQKGNEHINFWRQLSFEEKKEKLDSWLEESASAKAQWKRNQASWLYLSPDEKSQRIENFLMNNGKAKAIWQKYWTQWFQISSESRQSQVKKWLELNPDYAQRWRATLENSKLKDLNMDGQWSMFLRENPEVRIRWDKLRQDFLKSGAGSSQTNWGEFLRGNQEVGAQIESEMVEQVQEAMEKSITEREVRSRVESEIRKRVEQGIRESMQNPGEWMNLSPSQREKKIRQIRQKYMNQGW